MILVALTIFIALFFHDTTLMNTIGIYGLAVLTFGVVISGVYNIVNYGFKGLIVPRMPYLSWLWRLMYTGTSIISGFVLLYAMIISPYADKINTNFLIEPNIIVLVAAITAVLAIIDVAKNK